MVPGTGLITADECEAFRQAAESLPVPRAADGLLVLQCAGFNERPDPEFDRYWLDRTKPCTGQVPHDLIYPTKCIKQADVLLMMMLFAGEFVDEEVRRAWDYYLPLTTHDSSLSAGIHAIVALRLGLEADAWSFWKQSSENDMDPERGGAADGIHIAGAASNWQVTVFGFGGLRTAMQTENLTLHPRLPAAWSRLAFPIVWKGSPVYMDIGAREISIANRGDRPLAVTVWSQTKDLPGGAIGRFSRCSE